MPRITQEFADSLLDVLRRQLPTVCGAFLQLLEQALHEHSLQVMSNRDAQELQAFLRLCQQQRLELATALLMDWRQVLPEGGVPQLPQEDNSSQWSLVEDGEVEDLLEAKRLVRKLRETLGVREWRLCGSLDRLSGRHTREGENPLSLEYLLRQVQRYLQLREQSLVCRRVYESVVERSLAGLLTPCLDELLALFVRQGVEPLPPPVSMPVREAPVATVQAQSARPYEAFHHLREAGPGLSEGVAATAETLQASFSSLASLPATSQWESAHWVRALEQRGCSLSRRQREDASLVGEMFASLEREPLIAAGLKPALRSLLPQVLQATLQDPKALADPQQPVRATLERILQLADAVEPPNRALEQKLQQIIESIRCSYHGDAGVFAAQQEGLEQLLSAQQRAYRSNAERVSQFHRGQETLRIARAEVAAALGRQYGEQVPQVLLDWLEAGWQELLVHELIRQGADDIGWQGDLALTALLGHWLRDTNESIDGCVEVERAYQIDHLQDILRRRMEGFLVGHYQYLAVLATLRRQLLGEEAVVWVPAPEPPSPASPPADRGLQRWLERAQELQPGDSARDSRGRPLRLVWRSQANDHYVWVDSLGREAAQYSAIGLAEALRDGLLQLSEATEGSPGLIQTTLQDIVGRLYEEVAYARSHDELTGLPNRGSFTSTLAQALAGESMNSFLLVHVDLFVLLNQNLGNQAGDACLVELSRRLRQLMPADAGLARLGGVDFAVSLPRCPVEQARLLAERLRNEVETQGFVWQERRQGLTVSIGLYCPQQRSDAGQVLAALQLALNQAKEAGRNRVQQWQEPPEGQPGLLAIAARVDEIIEQQQLNLRLQQIAPARYDSDDLPHHELLLVMENELPLIDFISAAERYQRMPQVDRWVLKRIFSVLEQQPQVWQHSSSVSVNLSGSSINDDRLLGFIESLFEQHAVEPSRICFELTETAAVGNLAKTADLVQHLQRAGCKFSIDDFGVGFSTFDYLKRLPVDYVKIDGSFVKEIERSSSDLAMVRSINEIAHALGRQTIAEYVESDSIRQRLIELGVDYVQGYAVERPRPLAEWLKG